MEAIMTIQGVEIIGICDLLDEIYPDWLGGQWDPQRQDKLVRDWCDENQAVLYQASKEYFSYQAGADMAKDNGKMKVVVSNLS